MLFLNYETPFSLRSADRNSMHLALSKAETQQVAAKEAPTAVAAGNHYEMSVALVTRLLHNNRPFLHTDFLFTIN